MPAPNDITLVDPERLERQRRRRLLLIIAGAILVLLVAGIFIGRPASHAIKAWQARRHARQALTFITEEKWNDAQKEATAAYQLSPNEPEAIRAVARFLSRVRQPQALEFWESLATRQPLTRDDLRDEAAVALALGETERAATAIKILTDNDGREAAPADWLLAAQLEAQRGAPNESVAMLEHVVESSAANPRERLQAAVVQLRLSSGGSEQDQKNQGEAWQRIEKLAEDEGAAGLDALVLLAQRALTQKAAVTDAEQRPGFQNGNAETLKEEITNKKESITAIANALETHPVAQALQKLLAVDLRIQASPNEKSALIQSAIDRWKNADNKSLTALARWLNSKEEFQRELETIPFSRAVQDRDLFLQRLDALGALDRWPEIKQALNSEAFPLDPTIAFMYLARCNAQLGEKIAADNNWQRALEEAGGDAGKLMTLAAYAEKNGTIAIAAAAFNAAITSAPKLRAAWQGKLRLAQAGRDTDAIHAVLAGMLKIWPNDPAIQNDAAYTRLLLLPNDDSSAPASSSNLSTLNSQLSTIERLAQSLVKREPASLPHRTLLALVYLKQNRPATALGVYEDLRVPPNTLSPSALAVHAAVLQANGNTDDAAKEAAQVPRSALLLEEAALISGL